MRKLRIFISSPGDVAEERALAHRVIERLRGEFSERAELEAVLWEHEPLVATSTFQAQIVKPSDTDVTVCILWSRLGTRLPAQFTREDGSRYASGTEFEFEDAVAGYRARGRPDLLVYRKTREPLVSLSDPDGLLAKLEQKRALDRFIEQWFIDADEGTLSGAFHAFEAPEQFEAMLETHLRKLIERRLPAEEKPSTPSTPSARWTRGSPFRGLQAFDVEHADVFFGRTAATAEVLEALRRQAERGTPFVAVVGMSGGGKSSLVRAGVLPLLTEPGVVEGVAYWRWAIFRPADDDRDPLRALASALVSETGLPQLEEAAGSLDALADTLRQAPASGPALLRSALSLHASRAGQEGAGRFALVMDQMEELFTHFDAPVRESFVRALDALVRSGLVWVVATLRADVYPRLAELPILLDLKEGPGQYDLRPPTAAELGQIIRHPVNAAGLRLEADATSGERLEDLLRDAAARTGNPLPLLEFTLEELYRERRPDGTLTLDAYREFGGMEGSLALRAEEAFRSASGAAQRSFPKVMRQLVAIADPDDAGTVGARRASRTHVAADPAAAELVDALVDARLLLADLGPDGEPVVRIGHEALLRHWPRLSEFIEDDRDLLKARARLTQAARRWLEEGRSNDYVLAAGKPLEEARDVATRGTGLTLLEQEFLEHSLRRARRFVRLRRAAFGALTLLTIAAGASAWSAARSGSRAAAEALSAERTHQFTVGLLSRSGDPLYTRGAEWTVKQLMDHGSDLLLREEVLDDVPLTRARALREWARPYEVRQEYATALRLTRAALTIQEADPAVGDSAIAETWSQLGAYLVELDSLAAAEPWLERAATVLEGSGAGARSLRALGMLRVEQGRNQEAAEALERALADPAARADTLLQAMARADLARIRFRQSEYDESEALFAEALSIVDRLGGGGRPDAYASVAQYYSVLLAARQRPAEADSVLVEALDRLVPVFGRDHGDVALTLKRRGALARERGDLRVAAEQLEEAWQVELAVYGSDHTQPAFTALEIAQTLIHLGRSEEAETRAREGLATLERILGPHHRSVAGGWQILGNVLASQGRDQEALQAYDSMVAVAREAAGLRSGFHAEKLELRGSFRAERADSAGAFADLGMALEIAREHGLEEDEAYYLERLEIANYRLGAFEEAGRWAAETLDLRRKSLPATHPDIARSLGDVAFYRAIAGSGGVDTLLAEGWRIVDSISEPDEATLWAHRMLMNAPSALEDWATLAVRARKFRELLERMQPPRPAELVEALVYEAEATAEAGRRGASLDLARRALREARALYGEDHPSVEEAADLVRRLGA